MDLKDIEKTVLALDEYPVEKWNPKLCEGVEFYINGEAEWFYNGSKINRKKMVQLFSKLLKWEEGKCFVVTPIEKIPVQIEKEAFYIIDYKKEGVDYYFLTNTEEWVKLSQENALSVETINDQPYPKIKLKEHIWGLLSRNVFYKIVEESQQDGEYMYLESAGNKFYLS